MKFYKLIDSCGYVLSNHYEKSAEMVLGYGGVFVIVCTLENLFCVPNGHYD